MKTKIKHATNTTLKVNMNTEEALALLRIIPTINHAELSRSDTEFIAELFEQLREFKHAIDTNDALDRAFNRPSNK